MSDERRLGVGAMLSILGGNQETVETWKRVEGETIASLEVDPGANYGDGALRVGFKSGVVILFYDDARSCCEERFMHTDDDLGSFVGAKLLDATVREGNVVDGEYGDVHEQDFLVVRTSKGDFTVETHNRHNGYYGGIAIRIRDVSEADHDR